MINYLILIMLKKNNICGIKKKIINQTVINFNKKSNKKDKKSNKKCQY